MGKARGSTGNKSADIARKKLTLVKNNPFERRFGRDKHRVLNRRSGAGMGTGAAAATGANARVLGQPGVQKGRALLKRQDTLLREFRTKDKDNLLLDRRIGREGQDQEAGQVARFALEKKFQAKRASVFQLGDEEDASDVLTHFGRNLEEIERYDNPASDDEDQDDRQAKALEASFVSESHFGGFMTKSDVEFAEGKANTRQQWIESMISESKRKKAEKQKSQAENQDLTQDLDQKWKSIWGQVKTDGHIHTKQTKDAAEAAVKPEQPDPYDVLVRELTFETQGKVATERTKTQEEIIREEKEKLEKLEVARRQRMEGELETPALANQAEVDDEESASGEEESEGEEEQEDEEEEGEQEDDHSDLEDSDEDMEPTEKSSKSVKKKVWQSPSIDEKVKIMEEARREIPYTFKVPQTFEELAGHFSQRSPQDHSTIIQRIIKCNHPQFGDNNKLELQTLFACLLQYVNDCAIDFDPDINEDNESEELVQTIQAIVPHLYDLAHFSPQPAAKAISGVLQEKYEEYAKHPKNSLAFETLIFLKITCLLFPTSDYRHPVSTPAFQWITKYLSHGRFTTRSAIASGLFVSSIFVEGIRLSKRFSPELLNFLVGLVYLSFPKDKTQVTPFVPPFKCVGNEAEVLAPKLNAKCAPGPLSMKDTKTSDDMDETFVSSTLSAALRLIGDLIDLWWDLPSAHEVFRFVPNFLSKLCPSRLHETIGNQRDEILQKLERLAQKRRKVIQPERKRPQVLRQLEPEIDDNFDPFVKKRVGSREKLELSKLLHKTKREKKGAKKEIRADAAFIASQKAKDRRELDLERTKKTKAILSSLGNQEGDVRKLQRKKSRMK
ncbi:nucleolar protein 14-like [Tigriopus californicus]|uniref:nucleolar protein 14-like n=1 Tax=Tigriopus californicus TaxID=6832 RepID=UPI0027DA9C20|nr:nucleolar protein 14-like [Tigriopus californicus]